MSFSETEILSIDVDHVESNGIGTSAIEIIKNEVLDNQSLNIGKRVYTSKCNYYNFWCNSYK
mgnify:CR=1 FL=1